MKIFLLSLLFFTTAKASPSCEVFGITDSPQSLTCEFGRDKISLSCRDGVYYVGDDVVEEAFHYEVERGPVPLVFKTKHHELTVTLGSRRQQKASLNGNGTQKLGRCKL